MPAVSQLFEGMPLGLRTLAGVTEQQRPAVAAEARFTWNGMPRIIGPTWRRKWAVTLSGSGERTWLPDVQRFHPGARVVLYSTEWWPITLAPGETVAMLDRTPVPGTVYATDALDDDLEVPVAVTGKTATIFGRGGYTKIQYRPRLVCLVVGFQSNGSSTDRAQGWTLELIEEIVP